VAEHAEDPIAELESARSSALGDAALMSVFMATAPTMRSPSRIGAALDAPHVGPVVGAGR